MRLAYLLLIASTGCALSASPNDDDLDAPTTVRGRLDAGTRLRVATDLSTGSITAEKKSGTTWDRGTVPLPYLNGAIDLATEGDTVVVSGLQVSFDEIGLPDSLFNGKPSSLTGVRVDLEDTVRSSATWATDDDVTLHLELPIALTWQIKIDGTPTSLGSPELPPIPLDVRLTGDAEHVEATLAGAITGEFWSWAGVVKLSELELAIAAELIPPL